MIENMRKYSLFMTIVLVILAAGFLFTMNSGIQGDRLSSGTILQVGDTSLDLTEYRRMGTDTLTLANEVGLDAYINLLLAENTEIFGQVSQLGYNYFALLDSRIQNSQVNQFIARRILAKQAAQNAGIFASDKEIDRFITSMPLFSHNGVFDKTAYQTFLTRRIGRLGMDEKDLRNLVGEALCLNKLITLISGDLIAPKKMVEDFAQRGNQSVSFTLFSLNRDSFLDKQQPTQEEVKAYWESHKDAFQTEPKRQFSFIYMDLPPVKSLDNKASEEQSAKAIALRNTVNTMSEDITLAIENNKPIDLSQLAKKHGFKAQQTQLVSASDLPQPLRELHLRGTINQNLPLASKLFSMPYDQDPYARISDPIPVGQYGWIVFELQKAEEPTLLPFKDAYARARAALISQTATQELQQTAQKAHDALQKALKEGGNPEAIAQQFALESTPILHLSLHEDPSKNPAYVLSLYQDAVLLNPHDLSKVYNQADRSLFFLLNERNLLSTPLAPQALAGWEANIQTNLSLGIWFNWITTLLDKADIKVAHSL